MGLGTVKNFGYPGVLRARAPPGKPLREAPWSGRMSAGPAGQRDCVCTGSSSGTGNVTASSAWQVEHGAADPLGMEHSWRLAEAFVRNEVDAVRAADPASRS